MPKYNQGAIIRELRKQANISMEQLSKDICDKKTVSRAERGETELTKQVFEALLQRLGQDPSRFSNSIHSTATLEIDEVKRKIDSLLANRVYHEVNDIFLTIKNDSAFTDNIFNRQFLLRIEGVLVSCSDNPDLDRALQLLKNAIHLTLKDFDENQLSFSLYTYEELSIINSIGTIYLRLKNLKKARAIFENLKHVLEKNHTDLLERSRTYLKILYNLAKTLSMLELYPESLDVCEQGIQESKASHNNSALGDLVYNKAFCLLKLGEIQKSKIFYSEALTLAKYQGNLDLVLFLEKDILVKFPSCPT